MIWRIGVDIGGTFTDVALVEEATGRIGVAKVPTTPRDLGQGVLAALAAAMGRHGIAAADVGLLSHATPVVTNTVPNDDGFALLRRRRGDGSDGVGPPERFASALRSEACATAHPTRSRPSAARARSSARRCR